jgi:DNA-binding NarL/FixJ family response regulator
LLDTRSPEQAEVREDADLQTIEQLLHEILTRVCRSPSTSAQELLLDFDFGTSRFVLLHLPRVTAPRPALSPRELEIVRMVSQGLPTKVIANVLNISCWTVSTHVRRIFSKLGVTSRPAMVARMLDRSPVDDRSGPEDAIKTHPVIARGA